MPNQLYPKTNRAQATDLLEYAVAEGFMSAAGEETFTALFRVFAPQLAAFFRRLGVEPGIAEDLTQEVMFTVYRRAGQIRERRLFRAWLFRVARNAACRHFVQRTRQVPTVELANLHELVAARNLSSGGAGFEFDDWMKFLEPIERETMTLRFVEGWEYHEIAAAKGVPIGTVQWRVFNSKKKLAPHLAPSSDVASRAA